MAAKAPVACIGLLLAASAFAVRGQAVTPSQTLTPSQAEGLPGYEIAKRERDRVRLVKGYACVDPGTARMSPADIKRAVERVVAPTAAGYVPASRSHTVTMAPYPTEQLDAGIPGAALVMIAIREDGGVGEARTACATADTFAERARETALRNRYHPARLEGVAVPSVVFQMITYGVESD